MLVVCTEMRIGANESQSFELNCRQSHLTPIKSNFNSKQRVSGNEIVYSTLQLTEIKLIVIFSPWYFAYIPLFFFSISLSDYYYFSHLLFRYCLFFFSFFTVPVSTPPLQATLASKQSHSQFTNNKVNLLMKSLGNHKQIVPWQLLSFANQLEIMLTLTPHFTQFRLCY